MTKIVSFYARVSSEKQAQNNTISSQISALESRISTDGHELIDEFKFIDNGYSGSNLTRPALEKLRDKVSGGEIDKIYVHSPDRLSRKYVYQMILLEEFQKYGAEIIFLNYQTNDSPESHLLLQISLPLIFCTGPIVDCNQTIFCFQFDPCNPLQNIIVECSDMI